MMFTRSALIRATLALFLALSQSQVFAHGPDHLGGEDNPVCATCLVGHNLSATNHGHWALILPLAQGFQDHCGPAATVRKITTRFVLSRAPPA